MRLQRKRAPSPAGHARVLLHRCGAHQSGSLQLESASFSSPFRKPPSDPFERLVAKFADAIPASDQDTKRKDGAEYLFLVCHQCSTLMRQETITVQSAEPKLAAAPGDHVRRAYVHELCFYGDGNSSNRKSDAQCTAKLEFLADEAALATDGTPVVPLRQVSEIL